MSSLSGFTACIALSRSLLAINNEMLIGIGIVKLDQEENCTVDRRRHQKKCMHIRMVP